MPTILCCVMVADAADDEPHGDDGDGDDEAGEHARLLG